MTWDEVEPYYDQFEHIYGVHGKAGNLDGEIQEGGNPHEGPRSREYPNPPTRRTPQGEIFADAVTELGYVPFQGPGAGMTRDYNNLYKLILLECQRGGFCSQPRVLAGREGESPHRGASRPLQAAEFRAAPALQRHQGQYRFHRQAGDRRDLHRCARPRGRAAGRASWCWRPTASTTRGCCCSRASASRTIRRPARGVVGRNYSYQVGGRVHVFFDDKEFNPFIGGGMVNTSIDELNGDVIDRSNARIRRRRLHQHAELRAPRRSSGSRCRTARRAGARSGRRRSRTTTGARSASTSTAPA